MTYFPYPPNYKPGISGWHSVPIINIKAARKENATHLSLDGTIAYCLRYGEWYSSKFDMGTFGSWFPCKKPELVMEI